MELEQVKQQTTWNDAAESINSNNLKIITEVTKLQSATYKNKGYFTSLSALQSAYPSASSGSKAYVGTKYPYAIYLWQNEGWVNSGQTGGEENVNLSQFYTKEETDSKITETATTLDAKLTELSDEVVELNSNMFGNTSANATLTSTDVDNYQRVLFDNNVIIKAGATINSIDIPYYNGAYLATRDGFDVNARVDVIQYPYKVTEDIYGLQIKGAGSAIVNFINGSEMVGLVKEVEDVTSQTKSLNNKINDVYGEPIKTLSVNSASQSYQEVLFDEMIPKGSVIDYIAKSYNGTIYLTKSDGSIVVEDSVEKLISRTPYTTEYDIRGYLASELNCGFFFMFHPNIGVLQMRRSLNVTRNMSQLDIVKLMVVAFQVGNLDIIFETGTYEFDGAITEFLVNNLGYDVNYGCGIPIGNNCRYFFNGSLLKFTNTYAPKQSNCFDTKLIGSSFEMHDAYIECDGYYYAIHDESNASSIPYRHLYQNIRIKGENYGFGPFGIGTGFNTTLDFDGVVCDADSWVLHGPTNNPYNDSAKLILSVKNSYFGIPLFISSYDKERDSVEVRLFNSIFPKGVDASVENLAKEYITFNVDL